MQDPKQLTSLHKAHRKAQTMQGLSWLSKDKHRDTFWEKPNMDTKLFRSIWKDKFFKN